MEFGPYCSARRRYGIELDATITIPMQTSAIEIADAATGSKRPLIALSRVELAMPLPLLRSIEEIMPCQRTFNVARLTNTRMKEIIQKRTITRGSGQPFNSKW